MYEILTNNPTVEIELAHLVGQERGYHSIKCHILLSPTMTHGDVHNALNQLPRKVPMAHICE